MINIQSDRTLNGLVIGDCHTFLGDNLERFRCLGNYILDRKPEFVVLIGDFVDLHSLNSFDKKGGKLLEGARVGDDIQSGVDALEAIYDPILTFNGKRKTRKEKMWWPKIHYVKGNHEQRLYKWWENDATLDGLCDIEVAYGDYITSWTDYRHYLYINNLAFTHVPFNARKALESVYGAFAAARIMASSVAYGHSHNLGLGSFRRQLDNKVIYALNVGCFFEEEYDEATMGYATGTIKKYWRGVIPISIEPNGEFDFSTLSLDSLKRKYG